MMDEYGPDKIIAVTAYPKSGATWLVRLLGDLLDWPVRGVYNTQPVGEEGLDRTGGGVVFQTHAEMCNEDGDLFFPTPWHCNVGAWNGEALIHMVRDPRAVAVSAMFYWSISRKGILQVDEAMQRMAECIWPLTMAWPSFVSGWSQVECATVRYEDLHRDTEGQLRWVLDHYGIAYDESRLPEVIERQSFKAKRRFIETESEDLFAYNRGIQMSHLRCGKVGDWKHYFNERTERLARQLFGETAALYGYEL
jgi:hypothetical protein